MTYQALLGKVTIGADSKDFSVGGTAVALTTGDYYPRGYTGEAAIQLIEHVEDVIQAVDGAATATISMTTGKATLAFSGTTAVVWTDTELGALLGFTGNLSGASSYTSTYPVRTLWLPETSAAEYPLDLDEFWEPVSETRASVDSSGEAEGREGEETARAMIRWELLSAANTIRQNAGAVADNGRCEEFFRRVAMKGAPFRLVFDRSSYAASTSYTTTIWCAREPGAPLGGFLDWCAPYEPNDHTFWDCSMFLLPASDA